uniref:Uncharacterized protein n=1 Tax=Salix viminalis TaxID=40686 RepID=A0A6N2NDD9_SALVM
MSPRSFRIAGKLFGFWPESDPRFSKYAQPPDAARFLSSHMRNAYTIKSKNRSPTPSSFSEPQGRKNHH